VSHGDLSHGSIAVVVGRAKCLLHGIDPRQILTESSPDLLMNTRTILLGDYTGASFLLVIID
jgi:hypothetical protein